MKRPVWLVLLIWLASIAVPSNAAPFIFYRGILNAASFVPQGLPGGDIARGSIFSIFGRELGPADGARVTAFPLHAELAGVSIEVCRGERCVAAIPLFVRADQINAIMPSDAPVGLVSVRVRFQNEPGNWFTARVAQASFGVFAVNSGGFGPGVVQNFLASNDQPINSAATTARPGQIVTMWGTGLGPGLNSDIEAPQAGALPVGVEIWVGGVAATNVLYSGRSPCCAGVDQIVFEIPAAAPSGCYAPVEVRLDGAVVSNTVTIAIGTGQAACSDPGGEVMAALRAGGATGVVTLLRQTQFTERPAPLMQQESDFAIAEFREDAGGPFTYHPEWALPPIGSCITQSSRGALLDRTPRPGTAPTIRALDAGETLRVSAAGAATAVAKRLGRAHSYLDLVGARLGDSDASTLFQAAGSEATVSGGGAADVGAFEVAVPAPPSIQWTNRAALREIDRSNPPTLTWSGVEDGALVWIWGGVSDFTTDSAMTFSCLADGGSDSFTLPRQTLQRAPALPIRAARSRGWLSVSALSRSGARSFAAEGLDRGFAGSYRQILQIVRYH